MRPSSDPLNARGVPNGFVTSILSTSPPGPIYTPGTILHKINTGTSDSTQLADSTYTFDWPAGRGAVAFLRDFGLREGYRSNRRFHDYIAKHHSSWYESATRTFVVRPEAIILVSGWLKTTKWLTMAASNPGTAVGLSFTPVPDPGPYSHGLANFKAHGDTEGQLSLDYRLGPPSDIDHRFASPGVLAGQQKLPRDQCMFVSYYRLKPSPQAKLFSRLRSCLCGSGIGRCPGFDSLSLPRRPIATAAVACYEDFRTVFPPDKYPNGAKKKDIMKTILSRGVNVRLGKHGGKGAKNLDDIRL
ncbi:uncharacterized protein PHACADRAFT_27122 [Phanerochaete carnosa HHB-10118-sp]|uniref:Uncharacterized protein n=1 Tax=Phanerochaete carnosa (strain HHB-10118-sp) TaxID=650164 RepID=K5V7E6_PHACS|nr:uncharacterized protein PHACADRAFT_27122 [Phanerochaete carnosa HHB-10118-sp]EKM58696.1 hypothetical protein PHACADRAFT_27122 [Phanerochaete carnosa HHB-10118-sp]